MAATNERTGATAAEQSGTARVFRWLAAVTAILLLVQAVLAGRGMFADPGLIETHGVVGNVTFLAVLALVALAYIAGRRGALGRRELGLSVLLLVLVIAQLGLGYAGRESNTAASWHVPNGVLIFGMTAALLVSALARRRAPAATATRVAPELGDR